MEHGILLEHCYCCCYLAMLFLTMLSDKCYDRLMFVFFVVFFFCWRSFSHFSLCIMCILLRNRLVHQCRVDGIGGCSAPFSISLRLAVFPSVFLFDKIGEIFEWFTWWDQDEKSAPWMNTKNDDEKEQKNYPSKWANIVIV